MIQILTRRNEMKTIGSRYGVARVKVLAAHRAMKIDIKELPKFYWRHEVVGVTVDEPITVSESHIKMIEEAARLMRAAHGLIHEVHIDLER